MTAAPAVRASRLAVVLLLCAAALTVSMAVGARPAVAAPCRPTAACAGVGVIPGLSAATAAVDRIADVVGSASGSVMGAAVGWFTGSLIDGGRAVLREMLRFADATTRPPVTAGAFLRPGGAYHTVASIAVVLLVGFVFLGVIQGLLVGEGQPLLRLVRDIPVAVLAILGFPWLVDQLLTAADAVCAAILPSGRTLTGTLDVVLFGRFDRVGVGIGQVLLALLAFAVAVTVFVELVVRNVLVTVVVALAPLSFAAMVWPAARPAARRVAELTAAAILAKPAIFVALRVGLDLAAGRSDAPADGAGWGQLIVGVAVVVVAAFMPWVVWRLMPAVESFAVAQGLSRAPARAGMQALQTAYWANMVRPRGPAAARGAGTRTPGLGPPGAGNSPGPTSRTGVARPATAPATGPAAAAGAGARWGAGSVARQLGPQSEGASAPTGARPDTPTRGEGRTGGRGGGAAGAGWTRLPRPPGEPGRSGRGEARG